MGLSKEERSKINRENALKGVKKQKERLKDLEYKEWYGKQISGGILNSKKAIQARRENMIKLNKSKQQRVKASKHLREKWQEDGWNEKSHAWQKDKEKLMAATKAGVEAMKNSPITYVSKAEKHIKNWLKELGYKTKTNRFLIEDKNRFYDIRIDNLLIEIDGPWHFKKFFERFKEHSFDPSIDEAKNQHAIENGYTLVRISNWGDKLEDQKKAVVIYINSYLSETLDQTKIHYWGKAYQY